MKRIKLVIGIILIVIIAFAYAHIGKLHPIYDKAVDNSEYIGTGVFDGKIQETFICSENTLDGISAKLQLQGDAAGTIIRMTLIDVQTGQIAGEAELAAEDIKNSKFNKFSFETVENSKGKEYCAVFETVGSSVKQTKGIGLVYTPETQKNTQLQISNESVEGTLVIKTVTNRFDLETFCVFLLFVLYIVGFLKFLYRLFK